MELQLQNEELRTTQVELEESHRRYEDLYNYAPVGYLTLDQEGVIREANFTAAGLLGVAPSTLIGRPLQQFAILADRDRVYLHLRRLFTKHLAQRDEAQFQHAENGPFWAQLDSVLVDPDESKPTRCRTTLLDISDRRVAEQERLRAALVEHSGDPIIGLAPDETITSWNRAARDLFGYTGDEMSGRPIGGLFESERGPLFDLPRLDAGPIAAGFACHTADGRRLFVSVTASPVRDESGHLSAISLTVRDVTARRQAEAAEHQQRQFAEALVGMAQAINGTLRLDEVLDLILAHLEHVVAHDVAEMRTLLLELRPEGLERQSLSDLLQQLVDAVRGRRQIEPQLSLTEPSNMPRDVRLVFFRVAQEALNNVAKHSKASAVSISLSDGSAQVALVIEDNGVGFDVTQKGRGMGLESMQERADAVGAALQISQGSGGGTRVELVWQRSPGITRVP